MKDKVLKYFGILLLILALLAIVAACFPRDVYRSAGEIKEFFDFGAKYTKAQREAKVEVYLRDLKHYYDERLRDEGFARTELSLLDGRKIEAWYKLSYTFSICPDKPEEQVVEYAELVILFGEPANPDTMPALYLECDDYYCFVDLYNPNGSVFDYITSGKGLERITEDCYYKLTLLVEEYEWKAQLTAKRAGVSAILNLQDDSLFLQIVQEIKSLFLQVDERGGTGIFNPEFQPVMPKGKEA